MKTALKCKIDGCEREQCNGRGWCNSHYLRWLRHGSPTGGRTGHGDPLRWAKHISKNPPDECIKWPFGMQGGGYGSVCLDGKGMSASRFVLVVSTGINPVDKYAAHGPCHDRECVNPRHLSWKTPSENSNDRKRDGTAGRKLNADSVAEILKSTANASDLAAKYGVGKRIIYSIRQGKAWLGVGDVVTQNGL